MSDEVQRPPIRVALMGIGRAVFDDHYPIFKAHPELFQVAYACDLVKERRDLVAKDYPNCKMYRQINDMLEEREIDLVVVATGTADHVRHAIMSLQKGFWTLLESPMALTVDDAMMIKGQTVRAKNRLIVAQRGMFDPDFLLAKQEMGDQRLGPIYSVQIRKQDFIRRDDWQCIKRLGGGAAYYAMTDLVMQALELMGVPPFQMWSELKRVASLGDAEDLVHLNLRTREQISADIEYNGGVLPQDRDDSFVIRGERGSFRIRPGARTGKLTVIDPDYSFPRRRSSVRTPGLEDMHEEIPVKEIEVSLPEDKPHGQEYFWRLVYESVRVAAPFPLSIEESIEAVKFAHLMKKTSPFGK